MEKNNIIDVYKEIYNLPQLTHEEEVDPDFFRLCKENYNFVVMSIYNEKHEFLFTRDLNKNIGWELVGGYIEKDEDIADAVNRVILKEAGLCIDELQPIAIISNIFKFNNKVATHRGIAFVALSRERICPQPENIRTIYAKDAPGSMPYQNEKILRIAKEAVGSKNFDPPYCEIDGVKKIIPLYFINKYFIGLVGRLASKKIRGQITKLIFGKPKLVLDACCGDDDFIFKLVKMWKPGIFLANDISWKTLSLLRNKTGKDAIIFTNHNVVDLPFKKKFDLIIFKNSLHHIDYAEQAKLIRSLSGIASQLIVVDIEDPRRSNFLSKIWHWYYVHILGDKGGSFLKFEEFKALIKSNVKNREVDFGVINTIKGKYYYSSILDRSVGEEVEIKVKLSDGNVEGIRKKIFELGAIFKEKGDERDIYFTAPHRDFIKTRECLRIREKNNFLELTYKGRTTKEMLEKKQFWKPEINIPIEGNKKEVETLLEVLDFKKVADFTKCREKFLLGRKTITIDKIDKLGYFLEIEEIVNGEDDRKRVLKENAGFLEGLSLSETDIVARPYRDLVIEANNQ